MLTQKKLRELLDYDPTSGVFHWKVVESSIRAPGDIAGGSDGRYWSIRVAGRSRLAHRLAWLYMTGKFPANQIDHINGVKSDNRFSNLRDALPSWNQQNQKRPQRSNSTGFLGVVPVRSKFRAQIWKNGTSKNLGTYQSAKEAHHAYLAAKRQLHPGCTI